MACSDMRSGGGYQSHWQLQDSFAGIVWGLLADGRLSLQREASCCRGRDLLLHTQFPLLLSNAIVTLFCGVNADDRR